MRNLYYWLSPALLLTGYCCAAQAPVAPCGQPAYADLVEADPAVRERRAQIEKQTQEYVRTHPRPGQQSSPAAYPAMPGFTATGDAAVDAAAYRQAKEALYQNPAAYARFLKEQGVQPANPSAAENRKPASKTGK